ncbi:MAG: GNAT family N-acetyltransferase [Candidatus Dormibacteraeota bacterium]|uniref:GNAT family N-acetyltransferase n=1 Tax=Candidatus Dormiibacter inghamiae TaxID=3127013 RepID=A0A934NDE4_9BACT|nr:GNAT family N-acetyltransferase [Candidatus Dormibacteraeota bacterium]
MVTIQETGAGRIGLAQLEPSDREPLRRLFYRLSAETLYRRFMSPIARLEQVPTDRLLDVDHRDREAIVSVDDREIVGVARYFRQPGSDAAEMAVVVADAWQGQGLATRMLAALAERASAVGIQRFTLIMQADNSPILRLLRRVDPSAKLALSQGVYETTVPVVAWMINLRVQPSACCSPGGCSVRSGTLQARVVIGANA